MSAKNAMIESLHLIAGRLCLDFTNTMDPRYGKHPLDYLDDYADLVRWSVHTHLLTEEEAEHLQNSAAHRPAEASRTFERAIILREAMYRIFSAVAAKTAPATVDLDILRTAFVEAVTYAQLNPTSDVFGWTWSGKTDEFAQMLWPVIDSAIQLLTSEEVKKVKECPGLEDCGWLFLDTSKNGSRQWCSMEDCGSRAKMRRQYARKRSVNTGPAS